MTCLGYAAAEPCCTRLTNTTIVNPFPSSSKTAKSIVRDWGVRYGHTQAASALSIRKPVKFSTGVELGNKKEKLLQSSLLELQQQKIIVS